MQDVIALRKRVGVITGEVRLNGWIQESISFRRSSGYVEQFDVQTPELTVRETITFSARLRLASDLIPSKKELNSFVDHIMKQVELLSLSDALVGSDDDAGLSFEQKKRLSIAVELAASPSIIFLDEPTSGLVGHCGFKWSLCDCKDANPKLFLSFHFVVGREKRNVDREDASTNSR